MEKQLIDVLNGMETEGTHTNHDMTSFPDVVTCENLTKARNPAQAK